MNTPKSLLCALIGLCLTGLCHLAQAAPAANTPIGNQAKATYTDDTNVVREVFSNTVVTRVSAIYAIDLVQDNSRTASPGSQVFFSHTISNNGNDSDTITLAATAVASGVDFQLTGISIYPDADGNGLPDNFTAITSTGTMAAGAEFHFIVAGVVPPAQTESKVARLTVTATSVNNASQTDSNIDTVTITNAAVLSVIKSSDKASGVPGTTPVTYTLTYTNTGNSLATNLTLSDLIPTGMSYIAGSARWNVTGAGVTLTDTDKTDNQSGIIYDYNVTIAGKATFVIASVTPGQSGFVSFQVSVNAGVLPQIINNSATYLLTTGGSTSTEFTTNRVPFNVTQTAGVTLGDDTVASASAGSTIPFGNLLTNTGTGNDTFDISITSTTFPANTIFLLFQSDGQTPMSDTNGNGTPDTGPIAPGATYNVVLRATLPGTASGNNGGAGYTVIKTATSSFDKAVSDPGTDTLGTIVGSSVDITNTAAAGNAGSVGDGYQSGDSNVSARISLSANPGTTNSFTLYVKNTGPTPDSFNLLVDKDGTFGSVNDLPAGWTVTFKNGSTPVSNTGMIASGNSTAITAEIFVPADATPLTQPLYFQASSPVTGAQDSIHDALAVNTVRSVTLLTDNLGQCFPGGSVVYEHILKNNSNVTEGDGTTSTISITLNDSLSGAGFTSVVYYDKNNDGALDSGDPVIVSTLSASTVKPAGLAVGESVRIFVKVFAPLGGSDSAVDATRVTASTAGVINGIPAPSAVFNTDGTSVVRGDLSLLKEQAIDTNRNGVIDGDEGPFTTSQLSAPPGAVIIYKITATNTGAANATAITINDNTPANTSYFKTGSQGIANVDGNASASKVPTQPANAGTGALSFSVGTLLPSTKSVMTFAVKINQ